MTALGFFGFTVVNIALIDWLARLLLKNTRKTIMDKPAGLLGLFILALTRTGATLEDKKASLNRYFLSVSVTIFLLGVLWVVFGISTPNEVDSPLLFVSLVPLLVMPFFHVVFGLFGHEPLKVMASIKHFRLRSIVALVIAANIALAFLGTPTAGVLALHAAFAFLALVSVFFGIALSRAQKSFYTIDCEDSDTGPAAFFYYLCSVLEYFLYCADVYHYLLRPLWLQFFKEQPSILIPLLSFFAVYLAAFIIAKLFMVRRRLMRLNFYERGLLPLSFLFFGLTTIAGHYL